ncbi:hypothetical protein GCM10027160_06310 [Streptomyces calidiresistens]
MSPAPTPGTGTDPRPAGRLATALSGRAPARPPLTVIAVATVAGTASLLLLVLLGRALDAVVLIPPLAASAALVFAAPALPLAQPRNVIGGQLVSAVVGLLVTGATGSSSMWAAATAGGLAIGAMALARTPHSPAAATAVLVVLTQPPVVSFLSLLLLATLVLVGVGVLTGRRAGGTRYPAYWW